MEVRFRPLPIWPYSTTVGRRGRLTFKASWQNTLDLLAREVRTLDGRNVVIGASFREADLRLDGMPYANAREPGHPGIELSFDALIGGNRQRLVYATDVCERWEHNVRSIALGLESLRAVDRYGITRRGEQYAGFRELTAGTGDPSPSRGAQIIAERGGLTQALKATHPDHGGDSADFADVQAARAAGVT